MKKPSTGSRLPVLGNGSDFARSQIPPETPVGRKVRPGAVSGRLGTMTILPDTVYCQLHPRSMEAHRIRVVLDLFKPWFLPTRRSLQGEDGVSKSSVNDADPLGSSLFCPLYPDLHSSCCSVSSMSRDRSRSCSRRHVFAITRMFEGDCSGCAANAVFIPTVAVGIVCQPHQCIRQSTPTCFIVNQKENESRANCKRTGVATCS